MSFLGCMYGYVHTCSIVVASGLSAGSMVRQERTKLSSEFEISSLRLISGGSVSRPISWIAYNTSLYGNKLYFQRNKVSSSKSFDILTLKTNIAQSCVATRKAKKRTAKNTLMNLIVRTINIKTGQKIVHNYRLISYFLNN